MVPDEILIFIPKK